MPQLKVSEISCEYDQQVVIEQLSFELQQNEIVALLGPSGCGKTTLLKAIAGLMPVRQGEISIKGETVNTSSFTLSSEKRKLGMIFQDYALFPHLSVFNNIAFGIQHWESSQRRQRVTELLKLIRLEEFGDRFPHELSGGQQQRVAIARALAYKPSLMLLDEAFSNIDSHSRGQLMREIRQILKLQEVAAVLVTHSKEEAFLFADRIAVLQQGKIAQLDTAQRLYNQPSTPFVADFIGKANYLKISEFLAQGVMTEIGLVKSLDLNHKPAHKTRLMLRPEQIGIETNPASPLTVSERAFMGTHWIYQIVNNQGSVSVEAINHQEFAINERVNLQVKPHNIVLF